MKTIKFNSLILMLWVIIMSSACKKDWLNAKPDKALVVPSSIADYQALLDNTTGMNTQSPTLSMIGDGDYYVTDATYNSISLAQEKEHTYGRQPRAFMAGKKMLTGQLPTDGYYKIMLCWMV